jgi:hypothetical protein
MMYMIEVVKDIVFKEKDPNLESHVLVNLKQRDGSLKIVSIDVENEFKNELSTIKEELIEYTSNSSIRGRITAFRDEQGMAHFSVNFVLLLDVYTKLTNKKEQRKMKQNSEEFFRLIEECHIDTLNMIEIKSRRPPRKVIQFHYYRLPKS